MAKIAFKITGMDCAEEIAVLRKGVGPVVGGADNLQFDLLNAKMIVAADRADGISDQIIRAVAETGMRAMPWEAAVEARTKQQHGSWWAEHGRAAMCSASGLFTLAGLGIHANSAGLFSALIDAAEATPNNFAIGFYTLGILTGAWYVAPKALYAFKGLRADMNLLMTVAVIGAVLLGQLFEAASVAFLFSLALVLESWSVGRARNAIRALVSLAPQTARVRCPHEGCEEEKPVERVAVGAEVIVRPGERIPLDGVIVSGVTSVNQAPITGESMPVAKTVRDNVYAGTINNEGAISLKVTRAATDTTLARIIHMVEEAQSRRAKSEQWVETFAKYYTPAMMAFALCVAVLPPLFTSAWGYWFYQGLVVLVIACPCALVISTPVSIVAGLATAARAGVLIKGGVYLEQAGLIDAVALDKTGTLTRGQVEVQRVIPMNGRNERDVLAAAAALEASSDHPIARAISNRAAQERIESLRIENATALPGRGIQAQANGNLYWAGSHRMLHEINADECEFHATAVALEDSGHSVVAVGIDSQPIGFIGLADALRDNARDSVAALKRAGVRHVHMLTGDNAGTARAVARDTNVDAFDAELLPEDKVASIKKLAARFSNVAMIGDGVNDAPAMASARLGIAMGAAGSDAAIETADIALMTDDLMRVSWLIGHARKTRAIIQQNITFALAVKALFLMLALFGVATLWMAIAADMGASLLVIFNALRLLRGAPASE
ncbi:MAG: cadmium-translocating P-type ATPase [Candidatus Hydrogenedentes bacterium]|nr:cadmium-translocating P-type ATPase [Candidatus Hydrogenedentota bacterium]